MASQAKRVEDRVPRGHRSLADQFLMRNRWFFGNFPIRPISHIIISEALMKIGDCFFPLAIS